MLLTFSKDLEEEGIQTIWGPLTPQNAVINGPATPKLTGGLNARKLNGLGFFWTEMLTRSE